MNRDPASLFPDDLSDATAAALCDFLHELTAAADSRYLAQLLRYQREQEPPPPDPAQPWRSRPRDP
jgi:hypothetical protein